MKREIQKYPPRGMVYNAMACSGTADIGVLPGSVLKIDQWAGTLTIQASDVLDQPPSPPVPPDVPEPVAPGRPSRPGGTGDAGRAVCRAARPAGVHQRDRRRKGDGDRDRRHHPAEGHPDLGTARGQTDLSSAKGHPKPGSAQRVLPLAEARRLMVPQGTNVMVANLRIILIVNFLTMFGIGAELGIASVLADFSDATGHGHAGMFLALAAVALLVVIYAATATRTMADPEPGSSISSQTGVSFTL